MPPEDECGGPEDGIRPLLSEMMETFPENDFLMLMLEALSYDEEVVEVLLYLQQPTFGRIVYDVSNNPNWRSVSYPFHLEINSFYLEQIIATNSFHFVQVITYLCNETSFHFDFYMKIFGDLFEIRPVPPPMPIPTPTPTSTPTPTTIPTSAQTPAQRNIVGREPGFLGLMNKMLEIMPIDEWAEILEVELQTNVYLQGAIAKLQGDEFKAVTEAIKAMPEFLEITESLRTVGIDVDCMICQLESLLGWQVEPCVVCMETAEIIVNDESDESDYSLY